MALLHLSSSAPVRIWPHARDATRWTTPSGSRRPGPEGPTVDRSGVAPRPSSCRRPVVGAFSTPSASCPPDVVAALRMDRILARPSPLRWRPCRRLPRRRPCRANGAGPLLDVWCISLASLLGPPAPFPSVLPSRKRVPADVKPRRQPGSTRWPRPPRGTRRPRRRPRRFPPPIPPSVREPPSAAHPDGRRPGLSSSPSTSSPPRHRNRPPAAPGEPRGPAPCVLPGRHCHPPCVPSGRPPHSGSWLRRLPTTSGYRLRLPARAVAAPPT